VSGEGRDTRDGRDDANEHQIAYKAFESLAVAGDSTAMFNLGAVLEDSDLEAARRWWEQAAAAGNSDEMVNRPAT
jgi:TPR repeat protein